MWWAVLGGTVLMMLMARNNSGVLRERDSLLDVDDGGVDVVGRTLYSKDVQWLCFE